MAVFKFSNVGGFGTYQRYNDFLAGNPAVIADKGSMYPLGVFTLASNQTSIEFTNIPQTYSHLQLRVFAKSQRSDSAYTDMTMQINGITTSTYRSHALYGAGSGSASSYSLSDSVFYFGRVGASGTNATWGSLIIDILDYTNTNKYKTVRSLGGADANGSGEIHLDSGFNTTNTNAITSLKIQSYTTTGLTGFVANSSFALYGVNA